MARGDARTAVPILGAGVPVEIPCENLKRLVEWSTVVLEREGHRLLQASDWQRWGLETVRRYGSSWMALLALLALRRWGRITTAELEAARPLR